MSIVTHSIRHDDPHLFERSHVLDGSEAMHSPYLVIFELPWGTESNEPVTSVSQVRDIVDLLEYADSAIVLWQWPGKSRSDFFRFTVGEFRAARDAKHAAARQARLALGAEEAEDAGE